MQYLTKNQIAKLLHVSVRTITSYMTKGLLPEPRRLGRRLLWDEDELQILMAGSPKPAESLQAPFQPSDPQPAMSPKKGRPRKVVGLNG
jgi:predicted DNA-binding transcriptional regulator AlpA